MADQNTPTTDKEWEEVLSPERFSVMRGKVNEEAHSGEFAHHFEPGHYSCAACGVALFSSDAKFDAGTGWPSYSEPIGKEVVEHREVGDWGEDQPSRYGAGDDATGRTDVVCARCGGHLGHVFEDGPQPSGRRYCLNSLSLHFQQRSDS